MIDWIGYYLRYSYLYMIQMIQNTDTILQHESDDDNKRHILTLLCYCFYFHTITRGVSFSFLGKLDVISVNQSIPN